MTESQKGVLAAVVIVACLCLLGFLVHEKADGAVVAAVAAVTTLVGYFTRAPEKKDPPVGPMVAVVVAVGTILASISCSEPKQAGEAAAEGAYTGALLRCVDAAKTIDESRACRARVNAEWGIVEKAAADGGAR